MPDGHGVILWLGILFILLIATVLLARVHTTSSNVWLGAGACFCAVLFGWRLAFHLHLWDAMKYGGSYTSENELRCARRKYMIAAVAHITAAVTVLWLVLRLF